MALSFFLVTLFKDLTLLYTDGKSDSADSKVLKLSGVGKKKERMSSSALSPQSADASSRHSLTASQLKLKAQKSTKANQAVAAAEVSMPVAPASSSTSTSKKKNAAPVPKPRVKTKRPAKSSALSLSSLKVHNTLSTLVNMNVGTGSPVSTPTGQKPKTPKVSYYALSLSVLSLWLTHLAQAYRAKDVVPPFSPSAAPVFQAAPVRIAPLFVTHYSVPC